MPEVPILVISLKGSEARFENLQLELARFGLQAIRIDAVDGRRKASLLKRLTGRSFYCDRLDRAMTPGEIGCFVSHRKALRYIIDRGWPKAIILEDDAVLDDGFGQFYRTDLARMLAAADIVKLEGDLYPHTSRDGLTIIRGTTCRAIVPLRPSQCSAAYAVTRRGARSLVSAMDRYSEPFDFVLIGYERYFSRYCEVRPFLVRQSGASSIIADDARNIAGPQPARSRIVAAGAGMLRKAAGRLANASWTWLSAWTVGL